MSVINMRKDEENFLKENFKAGEYYSLTMMINKEQFDSFTKVLKSFNLTLAILPLNIKNGYQSLNILVKIKDIDFFSHCMKEYCQLDISKKIIKH